MRVRCKLCEHQQEAEHLAVRCESCGGRQCMGFAPSSAGWKPGEPMVGPSSVPHSRPPLSQMRGPLEEPLEVTRERRAAFQEALRGYSPERARAMALLRVPVQCGQCGGEDPRCVTCRGRATAPTAELAERRAARPRSRRAPRPGSGR